MKKWLFALVVLPLLSSCYSFNRINVPDQVGTPKISTVIAETLVGALGEKDEAITKSIAARPVSPPSRPASIPYAARVTGDQDQKGDVLCPPYMMPNLAPTPELPIKELMKVKPNDGEALDRIQSRHIAELREYIAMMKISIRDSHNDYLTKCYTSSNGRQQ